MLSAEQASTDAPKAGMWKKDMQSAEAKTL